MWPRYFATRIGLASLLINRLAHECRKSRILICLRFAFLQYLFLVLSKVVLGKIEQQTPVVVEHKKSTDINEIQAQLQALKRDKIIDAEYEEE